MENVITIFFPDDKLFDKQVTQLEKSKYKDELVKNVDIIRKYLRGCTVDFFDNSRTADAFQFKYVMEGYVQKKWAYAWFLGLFYYEWQNAKSLIRVMPEKERQVYKRLVENDFLKETEVADILGIKLKNNISIYYWSERVSQKIDLPFVAATSIGRNPWDSKDVGYYLSADTRAAVFRAIAPEKTRPLLLDDLPEGMEAKSFETSAMDVLPVIIALLDKHPLDFKSNKFSVASIKSAVKKLNIDDFGLENSIRKEMAYMRTAMLLQTLGLYKVVLGKGEKSLNDVDTKPEDAIIKIVDKVLGMPYYLYFVIFYHIAGLKFTHYNEIYGPTLISTLMDYLKKNPSGKWAEMESVINSAFVSTPSFQKLGMMSNYAFQKMTLRNKFGIIEHTIEKAEVTQQLGKPFVKGIMMLLAAWGMVDIACREVEKTDVSPYDSLLYFRINDFGAYSLGIKKDYSPLRHEKQELFHLDPDRLIIRSLAENNPYMTLLFDTCIPIGNGRFRADAATMLAHCKTRKDVEDKVNFFKRYISGDLPDVWNDFFHNLLQRCKPFHEEDNRKYKIFTLSEENKPLIHLLTSDPILRQLFLRAEKHYLIVPVANLAQFEKRLNSLGYLL